MSYNVCVLTDKKDNQCFLWQCITHPETKLLLLFCWVILVESLCVNPIYCWSSVHLFCLQIDCRSVVLTCELIQFFQLSFIFFCLFNPFCFFIFFHSAHLIHHWGLMPTPGCTGQKKETSWPWKRYVSGPYGWSYTGVCSGHTKQLMISAPAKDTVLLLKVKFYCVFKKKSSCLFLSFLFSLSVLLSCKC